MLAVNLEKKFQSGRDLRGVPLLLMLDNFGPSVSLRSCSVRLNEWLLRIPSLR